MKKFEVGKKYQLRQDLGKFTFIREITVDEITKGTMSGEWCCYIIDNGIRKNDYNGRYTTKIRKVVNEDYQMTCGLAETIYSNMEV